MNRRGIALAAALVAMARVPLGAQSKSQDRDNWLRNNCRLAVQVITTGEPAPKKAWAYGFIHECPEAGEALASAWDRVLSGGDLLDRQYSSGQTLDSRILKAAVTVASDASRRVEERWSALVVLTALYAPGQSLSGYRWDKDPGIGSLAAIQDGGQHLGSSPITVADRARPGRHSTDCGRRWRAAKCQAGGEPTRNIVGGRRSLKKGSSRILVQLIRVVSR